MSNFPEESAALVLVAAGSSSRLGIGEKKEYLPFDGGTVLSKAARTFLESVPLKVVAVTFPFSDNPEELAENEKKSRAALFSDDFVKNFKCKFLFVPGGASRQKSVFKALCALNDFFTEENDSGNQNISTNPVVFIHDGARPFVTKKIIIDSYEAALKFGGAVPALQPVDTQKEFDENGFIVRHLVRKNLAAVQTPQVFRFSEILKAHKRADEHSLKTGSECTDDTEIWDKFADFSSDKTLHPTKVIQGDPVNKKITYKGDLESIFKNSSAKAGEDGKKMIRTGLGYDKHLLVEERKLILGGVEIPFEKGESGHSDGDVLLHAVTDALLGASALGDIGSFFPPSDPKWKDADSKMLLSTVWALVKEKGWKLENLDAVIALEKPKFLPFRDDVRASIAKILDADIDQIFVKAKTGEKLGDIGEGRCVEVWCSCLLSK